MNADFSGAKLIKTEYASATLVAGYGKRLGLALDRPDNVVELNDKNIDYYTEMNGVEEIGDAKKAFLRALPGPIWTITRMKDESIERIIFIKLKNTIRVLITANSKYSRQFLECNKRSIEEMDLDDRQWAQKMMKTISD